MRIIRTIISTPISKFWAIMYDKLTDSINKNALFIRQKRHDCSELETHSSYKQL